VARRKRLPVLVDTPLSWAARLLFTPGLVAGLPASRGAARALGDLYPRLQPSRFSRAVRNITDAYPGIAPDSARSLARDSYRHLFQLAAEFAFVPRLVNEEGVSRHLYFGDIAPGLAPLLRSRPCILISGHVGNWELIGYAISMMGFPMHAVYRPLDARALDAWVRDTRERRGLSLVSKFGAVRALPPLIRAGHPAGLVADQSGGDRGLFVPFFGRLTSTYKSIGLLAMQTGATLVCGMARRLGDGEPPPPGASGPRPLPGPASLRYSVELIDVFGPEDWEGRPDPLFYLTARYRRAIEAMVRRAPEQYFWMHRVWRSRPAHERLGKPFPPMLREKLSALPWMTPADVEGVIERSERDRTDLARLEK
jgi:KDO2-lipid IV(A) lauroyltransferase